MLHHCNSSFQHHQSVAAAVPDDTMAAASTNFSLFFPLHTTNAEFAPVAAMAVDGFVDDDSHSSVTSSPSSPSSSSTGSVDCTLSLGMPSSRRAAETTAKQHPAPSCGALSWDVASTGDQPYCCSCCCQGGSRPAAAAAIKSAAVPCAGYGHGQQDPMLVDRRCANCGTSSTPLWRNGPRGPKSLCNACGIRFKKEERRAAATATAAAAMDQGGCGYFTQGVKYGAAAAVRAPVPYGGCEGPVAFPCGGGDIVTDAEAVPPQFLAWRLGVVAPSAHQAAAFAAVWPERTTLFQYN